MSTSNEFGFGTIEWGGVSIDLDAVPVAVLKNAIVRTVAHKLGNEVAAAVIKERGKAEDDNAEAREARTLELREAMVSRFLDGSIGLTSPGTRGNALEAIAFELAGREAQAVLAPKGLWPTGNRAKGIAAADAVVELGGELLNREALTQIRFDKNRDRLLAEAAPILEERKQKAKEAAGAKAALASTAPQVDTANTSAADLL